jgi:hypothetical protein
VSFQRLVSDPPIETTVDYDVLSGNVAGLCGKQGAHRSGKFCQVTRPRLGMEMRTASGNSWFSMKPGNTLSMRIPAREYRSAKNFANESAAVRIGVDKGYDNRGSSATSERS